MRLIVTGGGTGGHVYPGVAVAREIAGKDARCEILFAGARRGVETRLVPKEGFKIETLNVAGFKGKGIFGKLRALLLLAAAVIPALGIISRFRPDVVLGVGGYASMPTLAAALIRGVPIALAEQNVSPGMANRLFARFASRAFVTWPGSEKFFPPGVAYLAGNPVRPEFFEAARERADRRLNILVTGGSQGAGSINRAMAQAAPELGGIADHISITHQTGEADLGMVRKACEGTSFPWEAEAFFYDMPRRIAEADLVISRAGAGAVAEICAVGRAALYVPYPHAADDHQTKNAAAMAEAGAALMMEDARLDGAFVADVIARFVKDRAQLAEMGKKAKTLAKPDAARVIAGELFRLAGEGKAA